MFHPKVILRILGLLLLLEALFILACIGVSLYYGEDMLSSYMYTLVAMAGSGILLTVLGRSKERRISRKDGYVVVTLCWVVFSPSEC